MATKVMHRLLNLQTGEISLHDWVYDGYVSLNEVHIQYDDQLTQEHAQMVADAIDKRMNKMRADIQVMEMKKQDFLAICHKPINGDWEEVDE